MGRDRGLAAVLSQAPSRPRPDDQESTSVFRALVLEGNGQPPVAPAAQLPPELANDAYLEVEPVDTAPPGTEVLRLKAERIEQPANDNTNPGGGSSSRPPTTTPPKRNPG